MNMKNQPIFFPASSGKPGFQWQIYILPLRRFLTIPVNVGKCIHTANPQPAVLILLRLLQGNPNRTYISPVPVRNPHAFLAPPAKRRILNHPVQCQDIMHLHRHPRYPTALFSAVTLFKLLKLTRIQTFGRFQFKQTKTFLQFSYHNRLHRSDFLRSPISP